MRDTLNSKVLVALYCEGPVDAGCVVAVVWGDLFVAC